MTTRMLIDARHREETRVAVVKGNRIEEFDFESETKKQIKGNIYLAKVTRVEPSLQAAFIDYGGNRHGFLAFSEIHPDYYQIPKEDRDALLREEQRLVDEAGHPDEDGDGQPEEDNDTGEDDGSERGDGEEGRPAAGPEEHGNSEEAGAEALRRRRMALRRRYKIQEVIRRRQVMLVQVVKEERGNKGAALTTYISLAGRYSVLMPNTAHGGGISRKIANTADRKRLKSIMSDLNLPTSMGAIVRTAGLERTRTEIKRDFDYLTRLWDGIRETTLTSSAPALIYADSDLVKRAIRDIYGREIDEVLVDGEEGYRQAKDFMKLLMPSHARKVQLYGDPVPLFHRAGVESQLAALLDPVVTLRSGGYIVINPTEALVAIDVNSGRSTREYNIEETALKTNIEAAEEVARQLRLRDLAGLVVVDFIDMESNGNNRRVERALKDALKHDRARIQVGRISSFGLLEMSRQRLRTGVLEASTQVCPMCDGLGLVRTEGSSALAALRLLEEEAVRGRASRFRLRTDKAVSVYMLNRKRDQLLELERRYDVRIEVVPDEAMLGGRIEIDSSGPPPENAPRMTALVAPARSAADEAEDAEFEADMAADAAAYTDEPDDDDAADGEPRRARADGRSEGREDGRDGRRRRRRRGGRGRDRGEARDPVDDTDTAGDSETDTAEDQAATDRSAGEGAQADIDRDQPRKRRRRRRGGRGRDGDRAPADAFAPESDPESAPHAAGHSPDDDSRPQDAETEAEAGVESAPVAKAPRRRRKADAAAAAAEAAEAAPPTAEPAEIVAPAEADEAPVKAIRRRPRAAKAAEAQAAEAAQQADAPAAKPKRASRAKAKPAPQVPAPAEMEETEGAPAAEAEVAEAKGVEAVMAKAGTAGVRDEPTPPLTEAVDPAPAAEPAQDGEPRRGWWQRTFGT